MSGRGARSGPFIIGVAGGTASGKSSVCSGIVERLELNGTHKHVVTISQDSFYRNLTEPEDLEKCPVLRLGEANTISTTQESRDWTTSDAFETGLLIAVLEDMKLGKVVHVPRYDFVTQSRAPNEHTVIESADVVLVEGILIFFDPQLRRIFDLKLFVDADPDIRLARRVERDTTERARPLKQILNQYLHLVKPAFEEFTLPTKKYADVVIPRGAENTVAIELIVQHIQEILRPRLDELSREPSNHSIAQVSTNGDSEEPRRHAKTSRPH